MKATDVIRRDHRAAKDLFDKYRNANQEDQEPLESAILDALEAHEKMEDEFFYPALQGLIGDTTYFNELEKEQTKLKLGVMELRALAFMDRRDKLLETADKVIAHAEREEQEILTKAEELLDDAALEELGMKMEPESAAARNE